MKERGGKIGYFCPLVPREIISAAGLQPVRLRGETSSIATADAYLYPNLCPYIKSVLSSALADRDNLPEAVVFTRSCDGMRRLYDVWRSYLNPKFTYMLEIPKNSDEAAIGYFSKQLKDFASQLSGYTGRRMMEKALQKAIVKENRSRRLLRDILSLQRTMPVSLKGSEIFLQGLNMFSEPERVTERRIKEMHQKAWGSNGDKPAAGQVRILISGNVMDRPELFEMVEHMGAEIPVADLCTGLKFFSRQVPEEHEDPYLALSMAYLGEPHCAHTASPIQRVDEIKKLITAYCVDGVVLTSLKYCDLHLYDMPYIARTLADADIAVLSLENDYLFTNVSQMKTRVEAFIEMLQGD